MVAIVRRIAQVGSRAVRVVWSLSGHSLVHRLGRQVVAAIWKVR